MVHVTSHLTIGIALLLAIVNPCSSEPPFAVQIQNNAGSLSVNAENGARLRPLMALRVEQAPAPTLPVDQPVTVENLAEVGATRHDGTEGLDKKVACAMERVIPATSKQVREVVANVNRISATEELEHERMSKEGTVIEQKRHEFNYVAEFQEAKPGMLSMDEYRDGSVGQSGFPGEVSTVSITVGADFSSLSPERVRDDLRWSGAVARASGVEGTLCTENGQTSADECAAGGPILLKGTAWIASAFCSNCTGP
jgi:hypothetical protein